MQKITQGRKNELFFLKTNNIEQKLCRYILVLAHKEGYFQEFLIYKPEERVWIHLDIDEKDAKMELLKGNFVLHVLGQLYFIGMNSTFTSESEGRIF